MRGKGKIVAARKFFLPLFDVICGAGKKKCAIFFILLLVPNVPFAWGTTWDDLRRGTADISSVQADFVQSKHLKILKKPLLSQGRFCFQRPDSVRWEYDAPVRSVLLMNKGKVKRYAMGRQGMTEELGEGISSMQVIVQEISLWSQGRFQESPHF
ncbi:MAG: outer membrane lipoprotein carrier protein LolA, partial [Syntrophobacterales bacterium]|nr:outer membrane lipoprotein carrier protein LolA [Syntrophobacterales bacterium]